MTYILKKDIVIPAGTRFEKAPVRTERVGEGHIDAVFGLSKNTSGVVEYFLDDGTDVKEMEEYFEWVI